MMYQAKIIYCSGKPHTSGLQARLPDSWFYNLLCLWFTWVTIYLCHCFLAWKMGFVFINNTKITHPYEISRIVHTILSHSTKVIFMYVFHFHSKVEIYLGSKNLVISLCMTTFIQDWLILKVLWTHSGGWNIYNSYSNHCQPSGSTHSDWQKQNCAMHFWYVMIPCRLTQLLWIVDMHTNFHDCDFITQKVLALEGHNLDSVCCSWVFCPE